MYSIMETFLEKWQIETQSLVVYSTIFSSFIGKKTNLRSYTLTLTALFLCTLLWHNTNRSDLWPLILLPQPFKHWTHAYTVTNDFIFIGHSHLFPLIYYLLFCSNRPCKRFAHANYSHLFRCFRLTEYAKLREKIKRCF